MENMLEILRGIVLVAAIGILWFVIFSLLITTTNFISYSIYKKKVDIIRYVVDIAYDGMTLNPAARTGDIMNEIYKIAKAMKLEKLFSENREVVVMLVNSRYKVANNNDVE